MDKQYDMNILWFGSVPTAETVAKYRAVNEASRKWQSGLLDALVESGAGVTTVAHRYEQCWPHGLLFPGDESEFPQKYHNHLVRFINFPWVRFLSLKWGYYQKAKAALDTGSYDVLVVYNPYPWHVWAARRVYSKYKIPWVCLTLDHDGVGEEWEIYREETEGAAGHIFVSRWGVENSPFGDRSLHLDAGCHLEDISSVGGCEASDGIIRFLYTGVLSAEAGFDFLIEAAKYLPKEGVRIDVCGKVSAEVKAKVSGDPRFCLHGFVSNEELHDLSLAAHVLLNPRPPKLELNKMVFPSKLMEYLKQAKPIVTTWTAGLHTDYRRYVFAEDTNNPEGFARQMLVAGCLSDSRREQLSADIRNYLVKYKLWPFQARRFLAFIRRVTQL